MNVRLSAGKDEVITSIQVVNMQGATVTLVEGLSSRYETLNLKQYGAGVYLVKVMINNEYYEVRKVLIQ